MDLESFFPAKDRFELAMSINALLASPGFEVWIQGEPLDVAALLRTPAGKPRVSIFSIAHLDDSQRMFFVSLLLNAVAGWMRAQTGTSSLRAMVYMDEIFGFFPPVANPPSKAPLLTLLKQGRAFGLGVVLATQNPVDLDYKGLSNIGTWLLGRLQTERDKARVLDGLERRQRLPAASIAPRVDRLLSALTSRVFLMRNVHEDALTLFQSRWALSYLRGPLGRDEIKRLTAGAESRTPRAAPSATPRTSARPTRALASTASAASAATARPIVPPGRPAVLLAGRRGGGVVAADAGGLRRGERAVRRSEAEGRHDEARRPGRRRSPTAPVPVDWEQRRAASSGRRKCSKRDAPDGADVRGAARTGAEGEELRRVDEAVRGVARRRARRSSCFRARRPARCRVPTSPSATSARDCSRRRAKSRDRALDALRQEVRAAAGGARREAAPGAAGGRARKRAGDRPEAADGDFGSARRWSARCSAARPSAPARSVGRRRRRAAWAGSMKESRGHRARAGKPCAIEEQREAARGRAAGRNRDPRAASDARPRSSEPWSSSRRRRT